MNILLKVMMVVAIFVVVVSLGYVVSLECVNEVQGFYDEHGYWPDVGGPPVITDVRLMVVLVGVVGGCVAAAWWCFGNDREVGE